MPSLSVAAKPKTKDLRSIFEPKSVAVIGASRRKDSVGYAVLHNLVASGFKGAVYPVNPKADAIDGVKCFSAVSDLPGPVDLAVIILPSSAVPQTIQECVAKKVGGIIVISAGFKETGPEGAKLEAEIAKLVKENNIPMMGPNCLGSINTDPLVSVNASFSRTMPKHGNIAFISQSGALCAAILDYAKGENIGFSKFVSLGNKTDINELDLLRYLKDDPQTDVILMYVEDLVDGRAFIELAREITGDQAKRKPILAIKSGRTPQGAKAAQSHTGSLMGSDSVYDAIFNQAGVLRVDSVSEIFDYAIAFANQPIPRSSRVAIVTNAGGPGIMATDACVRYGLEIAKIDPKTVLRLKEKLPPTSNFSNPIDVIGDAQHDRYDHALRCILADPNVDSVIVILTPQAMTDIEEIASVIVQVDKDTPKTILACFMGSVDVSKGVKILEDNEIPHYIFPEETARTLGAMIKYRDWMTRPRTVIKKYPADTAAAKKVIAEAQKAGQKLLTSYQSMDILKAYGFPVLPYGQAKSASEATKIAKAVGFPVVLKVISREIVHKFDIGGVKINLKTAEDVKKAYDEITQSCAKKKLGLDAIFVQKMASPGREVILGMNRDLHFGPILMFGLGGIYVEALKDVTFRVAPIRELSARCMVEEIRAFNLLKGVRGEPPSDLAAITDCLQRLSQLSCAEAAIDQIDINPLFVLAEGKGAQVVDARVVLI
ncbi:MAG: acetate--CoA ligase alpha subunit [Candidatus Omnitrophota bacterium]